MNRSQPGVIVSAGPTGRGWAGSARLQIRPASREPMASSRPSGLKSSVSTASSPTWCGVPRRRGAAGSPICQSATWALRPLDEVNSARPPMVSTVPSGLMSIAQKLSAGAGMRAPTGCVARGSCRSHNWTEPVPFSPAVIHSPTASVRASGPKRRKCSRWVVVPGIGWSASRTGCVRSSMLQIVRWSTVATARTSPSGLIASACAPLTPKVWSTWGAAGRVRSQIWSPSGPSVAASLVPGMNSRR